MTNFNATLLNFNNANTLKPEINLIPAGTVAKAIMNIRSGGYEGDLYLTKSPHTGSIYLHTEFVILEGPFSRRKIFQNIGIAGAIKEGDNDVFGSRGRSMIRSILESARNILPTDNSEKANEARKINGFGELNGIICVIKIGIEKDKSGKYPEHNFVHSAVTPSAKEYQQFMNSCEIDDMIPWC